MVELSDDILAICLLWFQTLVLVSAMCCPVFTVQNLEQVMCTSLQPPYMPILVHHHAIAYLLCF